MDLSEPNTFKIHKVEGHWEFYWNRLLSPANFEKENESPQPDRILKDFKPWSKLKSKNGKLPPYGFATYRTTIRIPKLDSRVAIFYPQMFTASRVWINGVEYAHTGKVSETPEKIVPSRKNTFFSFHPLSDHLEIILQIGNNNFYQGGPRGNFWLGRESEILNHIKKNLVLDVLAFGLVLGSVVYHLFFFLLNRENKSFLYFALVSFTFLMRLPFHNTKIYDIFYPEIPWNIQAMYLHFVNTISILSIFYFLNSLFPKKISRKMFIFYWSGAILALGLACFNERMLSLTNLYYISFFLPFFIVHSLYIVLGEIREKKTGFLMSMGLLGLCFFGLLAIIINILGYNSGPYLIVGFLFYILFQSLALSQFFTIALENRSQLKFKLNQEKQQALTNQSKELQIIMHDSIGGELTDIHVSLENNLKTESSTFERNILQETFKRVVRLIQSFRNQLLFIEDLNIAHENLITGIHLTLLRRYSNAGREVDFFVEDELNDFFESNQSDFIDSSFYSELFYLFSEICTNDLKHGIHESLWKIIGKKNTFYIVQENQVKRTTEKPDNPTSRSVSKRVENLKGECTAMYKNDYFCINIKIPIPTKHESIEYR